MIRRLICDYLLERLRDCPPLAYGSRLNDSYSGQSSGSANSRQVFVKEEEWRKSADFIDEANVGWLFLLFYLINSIDSDPIFTLK